MKQREISHIIAAILVLTVVVGFSFALKQEYFKIIQAFLFSAIIILVSVFSKKLMANSLDADVEHEIWQWQRYGLKHFQKMKRKLPIGIFLPILATLFSIGIVKLTAILTYETRALKRRAAKRFGFYSYKEMTDWHNGLIGATGIVSILALAIIAYLLPINIEYLSKLAVYYAFWNLIPLAKLDGTQIFFGSKLVWTALALITTIFTALALLTP